MSTRQQLEAEWVRAALGSPIFWAKVLFAFILITAFVIMGLSL